MTLTQGQLNTFVIVASCCLACYSTDTVISQQIGDSNYCQNKQKVLLARQYIRMVANYNPLNTNTCLTPAQIFTAIEKTNQILGICTDISNLPES